MICEDHPECLETTKREEHKNLKKRKMSNLIVKVRPEAPWKCLVGARLPSSGRWNTLIPHVSLYKALRVLQTIRASVPKPENQINTRARGHLSND